ncbi:Pentatricopeptide repeat [Arabidopsis suecica]|uniref:Pentatricopeptide repeat n=1 Tax=Arabidopsis suecica TaxID=45249 RepID=A0A8T1XDS1_ARASU|nr:Pentatricopeptide repeat [Arabidopsis suecica]
MQDMVMMGGLSDTPQAPGRKRVAGEIVEKTVERRQKRMIKNRESAARSRARKQAYTHELEIKVSRLEEENEKLRRLKEVEKILPSEPPPDPKSGNSHSYFVAQRVTSEKLPEIPTQHFTNTSLFTPFIQSCITEQSLQSGSSSIVFSSSLDLLRQVHMQSPHEHVLKAWRFSFGCCFVWTYAARKVFDEMPDRKLTTWNAMIAGLIQFEFNDRGGSRFMVHAIKYGLELDLVVNSSLAHMYMRNGKLCKMVRFAIRSMPMMKISGCRPNKITFVTVLSSCSDLAIRGQGQQIHAEAIKIGASSVVAVVSSLISMYSKCGCLGDAAKASQNVKIEDEVMWSSMISAYGFHGQGDEAIKLFNTMAEQTNMEVNEVAFLNLLYACSHSGLKDKGLELFDMMVEKYGFKPGLKHYTCVVDLLGRAGCLDQAEAIIRSMPIKADTVIWKTLLSASKRWRDVSEVRKLMRDKNVKKEAGISWFEHKGEVHQFKMGDRSQSKSKEIYSYLKELTLEMKLKGYKPDTASVLHDMDEEEKESDLVQHSEKLAVAFALMILPEGAPIRIIKNLRVCSDCHVAFKYISVIKNREITLRDESFWRVRQSDWIGKPFGTKALSDNKGKFLYMLPVGSYDTGHKTQILYIAGSSFVVYLEIASAVLFLSGAQEVVYCQLYLLKPSPQDVKSGIFRM